jgi:hypothetical protein
MCILLLKIIKHYIHAQGSSILIWIKWEYMGIAYTEKWLPKSSKKGNTCFL